MDGVSSCIFVTMVRQVTSTVSGSNRWNMEMFFFFLCGGGKAKVPREKPLGMITNNKLNRHVVGFWIPTQATLVGGECSHHCVSSSNIGEHIVTLKTSDQFGQGLL